MAGAGAYLWEAGEVVTAANLNQYVQDQVIAVYADADARDAAYGGVGEPVLAEGMFCFLKDTNEFLLYTGSVWTAVDTSVDASKIPLSTVTTAGDLIIGTGSATVTRLAVGSTAGDVLTSNGSGVAPSYQTPSAGVAGDSDQLVLGSQVFG
jgi:hypothetical protein